MPVTITETTYGSAIQEICRVTGYSIPADPAGSTDSAVQQMGAAVNFALNELLTLHEWQDLTTKATLSIVATGAGQEERGFDLPDDFYRFIDQTQWSSASMLPAGGPVSNQAWMAYSIQNFAPQLTLYWQMRGDQLWIMNPPYPTPVDFEYMYLSKAQVIDGDDSATMKNNATKNSDTFLLDGNIITLLARARYLEWKGFDASAAVRDFLAIFNSKVGADKGGQILSLNKGSGGVRLIDPYFSLPNTGFGS